MSSSVHQDPSSAARVEVAPPSSPPALTTTTLTTLTTLTTNTTNTTNTTWSPPWTAQQELAMLYTYLSLVVLITTSILVANVLVLLAMYKYRTLRTVTNRFVVSLSLADLLVGFFFVLSLAISTQPDLSTNETICSIKAVLPQTAFMVSMFNLMGIAIDRYIAVMYPLHYPSLMRGRTANAMIIVMWVYAFVLVAVPIAIEHNWTEDGSFCYTEFFLNKYHLMVVFLHYWLGALTMTFVYACIFKTTTKHIKRLERQNSTYQEVNGHSNGKHAHFSTPHISQTVRVFGLVFGTFFCLLTPYYTLYMVVAFKYTATTVDPYLSLIWLPLADILIALNSTVNPYIYAWKYTDFRLAFKSMLCCLSQSEYNAARSNSIYGERGDKHRRKLSQQASPNTSAPLIRNGGGVVPVSPSHRSPVKNGFYLGRPDSRESESPPPNGNTPV